MRLEAAHEGQHVLLHQIEIDRRFQRNLVRLALCRLAFGAGELAVVLGFLLAVCALALVEGAVVRLHAAGKGAGGGVLHNVQRVDGRVHRLAQGVRRLLEGFDGAVFQLVNALRERVKGFAALLGILGVRLGDARRRQIVEGIQEVLVQICAIERILLCHRTRRGSALPEGLEVAHRKEVRFFLLPAVKRLGQDALQIRQLFAQVFRVVHAEVRILHDRRLLLRRNDEGVNAVASEVAHLTDGRLLAVFQRVLLNQEEQMLDVVLRVLRMLMRGIVRLLHLRVRHFKLAELPDAFLDLRLLLRVRIRHVLFQ